MDNSINGSGEVKASRLEDSHLYRLGELAGYRVASDNPDVRGWPIVDKDQREFGTIQELIVDPNSEKVRYLDVVTKSKLAAEEEERRLLIPIGLARIDDRHDKVVVREVDKDFLDAVPVHRGEAVSRAYEQALVDQFNNANKEPAEPGNSEGFYDNYLYDEDQFYTARKRSNKV